MSASSLVAEAVWKEIESTHSAILDVTEKCIQMLLMQPQLQSQCGCRNPMFLHVLVAIMGVACFLKPCFKLLTHDPRPSYFHVTVNDDQLWTTLREPLELSTKEVLARYLLTPVEGLSFRLQGNPEEKTSICVLLKIFALVIRSSMMLSTEENNFVVNIN
ncbi:uncharacterized protein [Glycine max]|uniref:uncharacterized protein isoform X3 n=1 Tax=Glycine max TaxID=3847 RepID=UPI00071936E0|nr:uncharacterized protein LOC100792213 isoform X3 [Glycine max]|eukprot:XP_014632373.1 uncharacterized protein LOC100792213 isoform X3 [Glycine max]